MEPRAPKCSEDDLSPARETCIRERSENPGYDESKNSAAPSMECASERDNDVNHYQQPASPSRSDRLSESASCTDKRIERIWAGRNQQHLVVRIIRVDAENHGRRENLPAGIQEQATKDDVG